jgi:hypothetical protein
MTVAKQIRSRQNVHTRTDSQAQVLLHTEIMLYETNWGKLHGLLHTAFN